MVIHSATHLFHEGEFNHGLRDLFDLDGLLRQFSKDEGFWPQLAERARVLDLQRPLYYGLHYAQVLLGTPVPDFVIQGLSRGRPGWLSGTWMDVLFFRALAPDHASCDTAFTGLARWLLFVRSHYLRMPLHLLLPHLLRKAFRREAGAEAG